VFNPASSACNCWASSVHGPLSRTLAVTFFSGGFFSRLSSLHP
jgi:hypothetical protein